MQFTSFSAARASGLFGEATRAGVTRESIGQHMNLAARARYGRVPDPEMELRNLERAVEIHNTWGQQWHEYSFGTTGDTHQRALARIAELKAEQQVAA